MDFTRKLQDLVIGHVFEQRGFRENVKVCRERLQEKTEKNNGTTLKWQEENACTMGGEKMHQSGYFKSSFCVVTANVTIVLPLDCRFVGLCCQQPPARGQG